jgi:hypothetical protein
MRGRASSAGEASLAGQNSKQGGAFKSEKRWLRGQSVPSCFGGAAVLLLLHANRNACLLCGIYLDFCTTEEVEGPRARHPIHMLACCSDKKPADRSFWSPAPARGRTVNESLALLPNDPCAPSPQVNILHLLIVRGRARRLIPTCRQCAPNCEAYGCIALLVDKLPCGQRANLILSDLLRVWTMPRRSRISVRFWEMRTVQALSSLGSPCRH